MKIPVAIRNVRDGSSPKLVTCLLKRSRILFLKQMHFALRNLPDILYANTIVCYLCHDLNAPWKKLIL